MRKTWGHEAGFDAAYREELLAFEQLPEWQAALSEADGNYAAARGLYLAAQAWQADLATLRDACTSNGWPEIVTGDTFLLSQPVLPPEILHNVLYQGGKMVYGGPSKAFKSWALQSLCVSVANGLPWLGIQTTKVRALYVNFELQPFSVHRRLRMISEAMSGAVLVDVHVLNLRGCDVKLAVLAKVLSTVPRGYYGLIVPDPIYKALKGKDENAAGDIAEICAQIDAMALQSGAAVVYGAHFAKGNASGKQAEDRISGSGVFARDPDAIVTATPHETDDAFTIDMRLRDFAGPEPFCIRWDCPLMVRADDLDPQHLRQPIKPRHTSSGARTEVSDDHIRSIVEQPVTASKFDSAIAGLGATQRRVREIKADVLDRGVMVTVKTGMPCRTYYCLPEAAAELRKKLAQKESFPTEQGKPQ